MSDHSPLAIAPRHHSDGEGGRAAGTDHHRPPAGPAVDFAEYLRTVEALRRSEMQFRRALDSLPAGAYTCDPDGLITYFNPRAAELWGRTPRLNDPRDRY